MKFKTEIRSSQKGKLRLISQSRYSLLMGMIIGNGLVKDGPAHLCKCFHCVWNFYIKTISYNANVYKLYDIDKILLKK